MADAPKPKRFYVTTPIYYANDVPHLGHAYTTVAADVIARFKRMTGHEVCFLTGTDEHGKKMEEAAAVKGYTGNAGIQKFCDEVVPNFQNLWKRLNISNTGFIRTTEDRHKKVVRRFWETVQNKGDIYKDKYEGLYCTACEQFYTEKELENGNCPTHKTPAVKLSEESYFFRMQNYQKPLEGYLSSNPGFVQPASRHNETLSFVKGGLTNLSVSRSTFTWGIPVPGDEKHVVYVWMDALVNYLSALGWPDEKKYREFWEDKDAETLHIIGKDILRFHAVYWPTFLMSAGVPLPKQIFAHGWWTVEGQKMSKTLRNVVDPNRLIDTYGADLTRYYLLRAAPFGEDGNFSHEEMANRVIAELSNGVGNLTARVLTQLDRFRNCEIREPAATGAEAGYTAITPLIGGDNGYWNQYCGKMHLLDFYGALDIAQKIVSECDGAVQRTKPWTLGKETGQQAAVFDYMMSDFVQALSCVTLMLAPFMPEKMQELWSQLGYSSSINNVIVADGKLPDMPRAIAKDREILFPNKDAINEIRDRFLAEAKGAVTGAAPAGKDDKASGKKPAKETPPPGVITIDDFMGVELRVATVTAAEKVEKSDKLLKLQVTIGGETRQVIAGIARSYSPEQLVGRQVVVVANLKPAKLMGMESQGMILAAETEDGLVLAGFEKPPKPGSRVK
ncbi:MAG: methionine--tRNA ligase [Deltaproteobacteria bacterium]|nr:methionine--tRNA ligase [Deltaproteobacteria bacterium]